MRETKKWIKPSPLKFFISAFPFTRTLDTLGVYEPVVCLKFSTCSIQWKTLFPSSARVLFFWEIIFFFVGIDRFISCFFWLTFEIFNEKMMKMYSLMFFIRSENVYIWSSTLYGSFNINIMPFTSTLDFSLRVYNYLIITHVLYYISKYSHPMHSHTEMIL